MWTFIIIGIAVLIFLYFRGKRRWLAAIKASLLSFPPDLMVANILDMTSLQVNISSRDYSTAFCRSAIEALCVYTIINAKGSPALPALHRDMVNLCSLITADRALTLLAYAVYSKIYDAAEEHEATPQFDKVPLYGFVEQLHALINRGG